MHYKKMSWQRRIKIDLEELKKNNFEIIPESGEDLSLDCFRVILHGPKDTPYADCSWQVRFTIQPTFPFSSPSVGFIEKIMHPNIDWTSGSVCLDALNKKWSPAFTLRHIMEALLPYLLSYPNPEDPLNREAAQLLVEDKNLYVIKVLENSKKYSYTK